MREATFEELDERIEEEMERGQGMARQLRDFASALPYAAFGVLTSGVRRGGEIAGAAVALPARVVNSTTDAPRRFATGVGRLPCRAATAFRDSERAGREAVDRILGRKSLTRAGRQIRSARSKVKSVATSASRAARASATAVEDATQAAIDPRDTRPYEERTRGELYELACERDITGRSGMKKKQLIQALRKER